MAQVQYARCKTSDLTLGKHMYRSMHVGSICSTTHNSYTCACFLTFITRVDKYPVSSDGETELEMCTYSKVWIKGSLLNTHAYKCRVMAKWAYIPTNSQMCLPHQTMASGLFLKPVWHPWLLWWPLNVPIFPWQVDGQLWITTQLADEFGHGCSCFVWRMEVKMALMEVIWLLLVKT